MADPIFSPIDIAAVAAVLGALAGQLIALVAGRGKNKADQAATLVGGAMQLVNELQETAAGQAATIKQQGEIIEQQGQAIADMQRHLAELEEYRRGTRILVRQLLRAGIAPAWQPPAEDGQ
jgi:hypothetical protein